MRKLWLLPIGGMLLVLFSGCSSVVSSEAATAVTMDEAQVEQVPGWTNPFDG